MRRSLCLCVSLGLVLCCAGPALAQKETDVIIAIVNDDVITLKDLKDYVAGIYRQLKVENHSEREIQEIMATYEEKGIDQLVEDRLILAAANAKGMDIRTDAVNKKLKEIQAKYPNDDAFLAALGNQGMTVTDLRNKLTNQMKARYIVDLEVREKVFVNPQDVTAYYNAHMDEFTRKTKYNLQSIYVSFNNGKQNARNKAAEARAKLAAGQDFDKVAKDYSEMPSVGVIEQGQMVPAIEKEVFALKTGQVSDPVEVEGGVYVFKVVGISSGNKETLEDAKEAIYNKLYETQFRESFRIWIDKLRKKSYVEIRA